MSRIIEILDQYEDWELAYFFKYMIDSYTIGTQDTLRDYINNNRGIYSDQVEGLIASHQKKTFEDTKERCPRCKSDKIRTDMVDWAIPLFHAGAEDELAMLHEISTGKNYKKEQITCNVCGYRIKDPNNRSVKEKISGFFFDHWIWSGIRQIFKKS